MPQHARALRHTAPSYPRRVSGPARRPALAGVPSQRGRTSAFERISRIPDHRVVDRLLRGRACILLIGLMLGGIVAMQVSLLRLNSGISRAVQTQTTLERQNMALQSSIAGLTSSDRVSEAATALGMIEPNAGQTKYLTARPDKDARYAAKRYRPPSEKAILVMQNNGIVPGSLAEAGTPAAALAAQLNGEAATATAVVATPTPVPETVAGATVATTAPSG